MIGVPDSQANISLVHSDNLYGLISHLTYLKLAHKLGTHVEAKSNIKVINETIYTSSRNR